MGSAAAEMFKPRALFFFLVVSLVCLVQTKESKTNDDDDKTIFTIQANIKEYQRKLFERLEGVEQAIVATIREGKPGLCTTCWYRTWRYDCNDITDSNLARCRRDVCPRCRYDERCTHDWCGPPPTTSTTTTSTSTETTPSTTTVTTPTTTDPSITSTTVTPPPTTSDTTSPPTENNNDTTTLTTSTGFVAGK